jgi:hypothetical protein
MALMAEEVARAATVDSERVSPGPVGFRRLFFFLNPFLSTQRRDRRLLRVIAKHLKATSSHLYTPLTGKLTPRFATEIESLQRGMHYFGDLFALLGSDRIAHVQHKIVNLLLQNQRVSLRMMKFDDIKAELERDAGTAAITPENVQQIFDVRYRAFESIHYTFIHATYRELLQGVALAEFDFESILSVFRREDFAENRRYAARDAAGILDSLKDLHYVLSGYTPTPNGLKLLRLLSGIGGVPLEDGEKAIRSHFAIVHGVIQTTVTASFLADTIRMTATAPELVLPSFSTQTSFVEEIRETVKRRFDAQIREYTVAESQKVFHAQIRKLFPDVQLPEVEGYTNSVSSRLVSVELPAFRYITPLRLAHTFDQNYYTTTIKPVLTELAGKIEFSNPDDQVTLDNALRELGLLSSHIKKFSSDITDPQFSRLPALLAAIERDAVAPEDRKRALPYINDVDKRADGMIQASIRNASSVAALLDTTVLDNGAIALETVYNYRSLRASSLELLNEVEKAVTTLKMYNKLMKHFAVNTAPRGKHLSRSGGAEGA